MQDKKFPSGLRAALVMLTVALFVTTSWAATEKVLHNFGRSWEGSMPSSSPTSDAAGNLYGTTGCTNFYNGTCSGHGTVFELTPSVGGGWSEKVLHIFSDHTDGAFPEASLIWDTSGNLYGTTRGGGAHGRGTVFELTPTVGGNWTEKVLYSFHNIDGNTPISSLIWDAAGSLYGTTAGGGTQGDGTVFELTPTVDGGWTEKVLHNFGNYGTDGLWPQAALIFDAAGNLYGTTLAGGSHPCGEYGCGTVFELTPRVDGGWTERVVHNFGITATDGQWPYSSLVWDASGNLYGTTSVGGAYAAGTVFEMTPKDGGGWTEKVLHNFGITGTDGQNPVSNLIWDTSGNLYGTTSVGGVYAAGTVFEMTPREGGGWTEKKLHNFGHTTDGGICNVGLIWDAVGNLYGVTNQGGDHRAGTVFEITP